MALSFFVRLCRRNPKSIAHPCGPMSDEPNLHRRDQCLYSPDLHLRLAGRDRVYLVNEDRGDGG